MVLPAADRPAPPAPAGSGHDALPAGTDPVDLLVRVRHLVAADGITYTPTGDAGRDVAGAEPQPWRLDPLPLVVPEARWTPLAAALEQRSRLLAAVVADLAGERTLLHRGLLPAELVLAHHGHLPGAHASDAPGRLLLHAVDLARTTDGEVLALSDRTQAPSGLGYALADRRVLARALPEHLADVGPRPLGGFQRALAVALREVAPAAVEHPLVVVLSPGSQSETAFDQASLAAALGVPLVQSADLVVRRGRLWLRSLGELEQVDVVLRRVDADYADPLDLRRGSHLGVTGLAEAVRRGGVRVVNGLGATVGENPALPAFLPALCRALLGEELTLASVPTWWCGEPAARSHVLARADELVVHDLAAGTAATPRTMTAAARADWARDVAARPWCWAGRLLVEPATAPALDDDGRVVQAWVGLRTFTLDTPGGPTAMPGALGRVLTPDPAGGLPRSGAAKDVWVRPAAAADLPAAPVLVRPGERGVAVADPGPRAPRRAAPVPVASARVLADLHWLGRYAERAEGLARGLLAVDDRGWAEHPAGRAVLTALAPDAGRAGLRARLVDPGVPGSVARSVAAAQGAARAVRDQLSGDTWAVLAGVDAALGGARARPATWRAGAEAVVSGLLALSGLVAENMVRDPGWLLLDVGRRLERAQQVTALLAGTLTTAGPDEAGVVETVLVATESVVTHRRRGRGRAGAGTALDLLLLDPTNPRGVTHQLAVAGERLRTLPHATGTSRPERLLEEAAATLRRTDPARLALVGPDGDRPRLAELLSELGTLLRETADAVEATHLRLPAPARPLEAGPSAAAGVPA